jgi:hypothetical protein
VEARARAVLITSEVKVNEATLACDSENVTATVTADQSSVRSAAPKTGASLNDLLIDTFEQALSRLSAQTLSRAVTPPESEPNQAAAALEQRQASPPPAPGLAPARQPSPAGAPALRPASERPRFSRTGRAVPPAAELACGAALEAWGGDAAMGPVAGASYALRALSLALRAEALFPLRPAPAFRAVELSAALALQWHPTWSGGARLFIGAGASLLSATVNAPYASQGATHVGAGFVDLTLSRPLWLGPWALVPEAGLRLFSARRSVTLDQHTQLSLPLAAPHLAVNILRRFE